MPKWPRFSFPLALHMCLNLAFASDAVTTFPDVTNVSVTCHNFTNVLYWNYSAPDLQPEFFITIRGYGSEPTSMLTRQTHLDISEYTQTAETGYYITVDDYTKGPGVNYSSAGVMFSYEDSALGTTCMVDFPMLNIHVLSHKVSLSFFHPYRVHKVESLNEIFMFTVSTNETQVLDEYCEVEDQLCTAEFPLFESLYGNCINVHIKGSVKNIPTEVSQEICDPVPPDTMDWTVLIAILVCSMAGLLIAIILGGLIFKKLTQPDSESTIFSKLLRMVNSNRAVQEPEQPVLTKVVLVGQTPHLDPSDLAFSDPSGPAFSDLCSLASEENPLVATHIPIGQCNNVKLVEDPEEDADSGGFNSDNSFSGYDCQKFPIDMGQGDIVEAYGPHRS